MTLARKVDSLISNLSGGKGFARRGPVSIDPGHIDADGYQVVHLRFGEDVPEWALGLGAGSGSAHSPEPGT